MFQRVTNISDYGQGAGGIWGVCVHLVLAKVQVVSGVCVYIWYCVSHEGRTTALPQP